MKVIKASPVDTQAHYYDDSISCINEAQLQDASEAAYYLGGQYRVCMDMALPSQINNTSTLMAAWEEGRDDAAYSESVQDCHHCSTANGDPCIIHD